MCRRRIGLPSFRRRQKNRGSQGRMVPKLRWQRAGDEKGGGGGSGGEARPTEKAKLFVRRKKF